MKSVSPTTKRSLSADPVDLLLGDHTQPHQRKRECLDHLTHEEKLNRRKMKNRIAAQTARDRKKYRSQRLEDVVRELLEQNETLRQENELLRIANDDLSRQNRSLMARLSSSSDDNLTCRLESEQPMIYEEVNYEMMENSEKAVESAAFISGPLQRVQVAPAISPTTSCDQCPIGGVLQSDELEKILSDFSDEVRIKWARVDLSTLVQFLSSQLLSANPQNLQSLEFDVDQLFQQLPDEQFTPQQCVSAEQVHQPTCSASGTSSPVDASFLDVPRCSPSVAPSYPLLSSPESVDEMTLFDDQKLLDDPMLSSPSSWICDNPHALSPFSDSFQREFFQMLE
ncbi:bZIP transcription factor [Parelaphostrongylus tenuis]|uniref:X-box-binding protein 1 n=1 Tax=Parelaphostrongylus tenuis TaxID=148309 RepID=A0AAD5RBE9_PARTN|nr:bZIP transcription factor [Parelaphostrongylus tenuis]